jgi:hypothetical protein
MANDFRLTFADTSTTTAQDLADEDLLTLINPVVDPFVDGLLLPTVSVASSTTV